MKTEIFTLLRLDVHDDGNYHADVKVCLSFDEAESHMKKEYEDMELEKGLQPVLDFPESYINKEKAAFFYQEQNNISSCKWQIGEIAVEVPTGIVTKKGYLSAVVTGDPAHPGIAVSLNMDGLPVELTLIEFSDDEGDISGEQIITRVWGDGFEEDYTNRIIHKLPVAECWAGNEGRMDTRGDYVICKECGTHMFVDSGLVTCPKCGGRLQCADPSVTGILVSDADGILRKAGMGCLLKYPETSEGWSVHTYDRQGNRKEIIRKDTELGCAKACVAQLRLGYPAPTVWFNGRRVEDY